MGDFGTVHCCRPCLAQPSHGLPSPPYRVRAGSAPSLSSCSRADLAFFAASSLVPFWVSSSPGARTASTTRLYRTRWRTSHTPRAFRRAKTPLKPVEATTVWMSTIGRRGTATKVQRARSGGLRTESALVPLAGSRCARRAAVAAAVRESTEAAAAAADMRTWRQASGDHSTHAKHV